MTTYTVQSAGQLRLKVARHRILAVPDGAALEIPYRTLRLGPMFYASAIQQQDRLTADEVAALESKLRARLTAKSVRRIEASIAQLISVEALASQFPSLGGIKQQLSSIIRAGETLIQACELTSPFNSEAVVLTPNQAVWAFLQFNHGPEIHTTIRGVAALVKLCSKEVEKIAARSSKRGRKGHFQLKRFCRSLIVAAQASNAKVALPSNEDRNDTHFLSFVRHCLELALKRGLQVIDRSVLPNVDKLEAKKALAEYAHMKGALVDHARAARTKRLSRAQK